MGYERYGVMRVKKEPETFWIFALDPNSRRGSPFMTTTHGLSEEQTRLKLKEMGHTEAETDGLIENARAKHTGVGSGGPPLSTYLSE